MQADDVNLNFGSTAMIDSRDGHAAPPSFEGPVSLALGATLLSLGGLVGWSYAAKIAAAVIVSGTVVAESGSKYIQHPTGGIVSSIEVREGQDVSVGQTLIKLDSKSLDLNERALQHLLAMNAANLARLNAEQNDERILNFGSPPEPEENSKDWEEITLDQQRLFSSRHTALMDKVDTLRSDGSEALAVTNSVSAQLEAQRTRIDLTEQELLTASHMASLGYGTKQRVLEIKRALAELESDLSSLEARKFDALQNFEHAQLEIRQQKADFMEGVQGELQTVQKENAELTLKLKTFEQQSATLSVKAPVSGRVVNIAVHTLGGVVMAGEPILEIVPTSDPLVLEAELRPEDALDVAVGQPVDIRLAGPEGQRVPRLSGRVTLISADRIQDPQRATPYFRIRAEVSQAALDRVGIHQFRPGMEVMLMIKQKEETPLVYLTTPLLEFFKRSLH